MHLRKLTTEDAPQWVGFRNSAALEPYQYWPNGFDLPIAARILEAANHSIYGVVDDDHPPGLIGEITATTLSYPAEFNFALKKELLSSQETQLLFQKFCSEMSCKLNTAKLTTRVPECFPEYIEILLAIGLTVEARLKESLWFERKWVDEFQLSLLL